MRFTNEEVETILDALYFAADRDPNPKGDIYDIIYKIKRIQRKK